MYYSSEIHYNFIASMDTNTIFNTYSNIVEDWSGGYKLQFDLTSRTKIDGWEVKFDLPYQITGDYGVDIVEHSNGTYTIKGEGGWANLNEGESIEGILIIEDNGKTALPLKFYVSEAHEIKAVIGDNPQHITANSDSKTTSEIDYGDTFKSVDRDFNGDLARAIAEAQDGTTLELSGKTYYTSGLIIDKDITIFGREGATINGGGTSESIIRFTPSASGATLDNIDITNGNNGIYSYGASNLTLQNLGVYDIGNSRRISGGENNTGIILNYAEGANVIDSHIHNVSRKGISIGDTDGATISGLRVEGINLAAQHSQSHDAAGIKLFNTNNIVVRDNYLSNINANHIWNDTTNKTTIRNNTIENIGSAFKKPSFDYNTDISGIYNEKSANSAVKHNYTSSIKDFAGYNGTKFTTESAYLEDNDFSIMEINTVDYWTNEAAEIKIATTEDPAAADFSLISEPYLASVIID